MAKKSSRRGKRYTAQQRQAILAAAAKEGLTGDQVAKRFGGASLTFYRWRGPVRGPKVRANAAQAKVSVDERGLRVQVRTQIAEVLPQIIQEEVAQIMSTLFGPPRRGRRRSA